MEKKQTRGIIMDKYGTQRIFETYTKAKKDFQELNQTNDAYYSLFKEMKNNGK